MKQNVYKVIAAVLLLSGAYFAGRYSNPTKEVVRIETVEVEVESKQRDIEITRNSTVTEKPDGTKITEFETREREISSEESSSNRSKDSEHVREFDKSKWSVGVYGSTTDRVLATVDRRIVGNLFVGAYAGMNRTDYRDHEYGVGIRFEF